MYAVVKTGGKQYMVSPGDRITVEKLDGEKSGKLSINEVLLISKDGETPIIGKPFIDGAKVDCEIMSQGRSKKVVAIKFRRRKRYMRKLGHRQELTMLKVNSISYDNNVWNAEGK
jgi:large subunit ribosomal protein L21